MKPEDKRGAGWFFKTLFILVIAGSVIATLVGVVAFTQFSSGLPKIITVSDYRPLGVTRIYAAGGRDEDIVGEFYKERRYLIPYDKIPDLVVKAFIAAEDDKFFDHQGINPASIIRAAIVNFKAGQYVQGGSTITMQVVKSLMLTPERSFIRKLKEVILASRIEKNLTKQQILYLYLNQIYLGHGNYGVQAASRSYFRKDVADLSIAEAAMVAGLPQAPGKYSPHLNPKKAKERQLYVLRRMYENKFISQSQMADSAALPLRIYYDEDINLKYGPYYVEHVRRHLVDKYGDKAVYEGGLVANIPPGKELMLAAKESLKEGLRQIDKRIGYRGPQKKLKGTDAIEKELKEIRLQMIRKKLQHAMLMPDGRLDAIEPMMASGMQTDAALISEGGIFEAVVTSVDDARKTAGVMMGAVRAELPMEAMKWAHPVRDAKRPQGYMPEPKTPSRVVSKGDVILVRVDKIMPGRVLVSLEQEPQVQGAIFSMDAASGHVVAMEGGYDFSLSEFNRAFQAQRQPGSAFKPVIYTVALEKGYNPATVIVDSPIVYGDGDNGKWKPANFEEKFYGDTTFRQALIKSRNVPTIKIVQAIQVQSVLEFAKRVGLNAQIPPDLSISLGSAAVSLVELTKIYALFPRLGRRITPVFISAVKDRDGKVLEETMPSPSASPALATHVRKPEAAPSGRPDLLPAYPPADDPEQVMDPRVAYVMTNLMKEVISYGTGHGAKSLGRIAAGKTGTTNEYNDAWFMGFTPDIVTGVWTGFDNQRQIGPGETGARSALPIWLNFMKEAVKNRADADFNIPPGVVFVSIDAVSGKLTSPNAANSIKEAFIEGSEPTEAKSRSEATRRSHGSIFKEDMD